MRKLLVAFLLTGAAVVFFLFFAFIFLVETAPLSRGEYLYTFARTKAYKYTGLPGLSEGEVKILYRWSCTGKCHGAEPIETSRHTAREWQTIIERMRVKNRAKVNERETLVIASYLQKNYGSNVPTILSPGANRFLKHYLWKSDFGESDLYVDIIYAPREYFELMGGILDSIAYEASEKLVFMVYLNTHQSKLLPFPIKEMAMLRDSEGNEFKPLDWKVTYESGDMHHREGVLRFENVVTGKVNFMELVLKDLPGQKQRLFRWELPIPELDTVLE